MSIVDEVEKILNEKKRQPFDDPEFVKMHEHYLKMKELGLVKPQGYDIAPADTIGRRYYEHYLSLINSR
ncbi:MAG: hypothetical protein L7F77_16375 [Candidatus Magnetominusculus sp. LBB02]|nr:hypothetical protein [Candidatus Magnetominusculus sp. LBB02]